MGRKLGSDFVEAALEKLVPQKRRELEKLFR